MDKEVLLRVIYEQRAQKIDFSVKRKLDDRLILSDEILVITGVRRCGKSMLMRQIQQVRPERDYYLNFDDERLVNFSVDDFQMLDEVFVEEFGVQHTYYLDEIQNVAGWERFVSRLYSHGNKVFVTGSNANLLSRELGTYLTGRHVKKELYPFSFREYLDYRNVLIKREEEFTTEGRVKILGAMREYLESGGFPQYLKSGNTEYLSALYNDILYKDVMVRNNLNNEAQLKEMVYWLASNATHPFTYNSLAKKIGVKASDTVKAYIGYIEDTYLLGQLNKYDHSVGEQFRSPRKIYFVDNAIISRLGFNATDNRGTMLENAVYVELLRRGGNVYYYSDVAECDFIVRTEGKITSAVQVSWTLDDTDTRHREIRGVKSAMDAFRLDEGYIITFDTNETITTPDGKTIYCIPVWRWMLK